MFKWSMKRMKKVKGEVEDKIFKIEMKGINKRLRERKFKKKKKI